MLQNEVVLSHSEVENNIDNAPAYRALQKHTYPGIRVSIFIFGGSASLYTC